MHWYDSITDCKRTSCAACKSVISGCIRYAGWRQFVATRNGNLLETASMIELIPAVCSDKCKLHLLHGQMRMALDSLPTMRNVASRMQRLFAPALHAANVPTVLQRRVVAPKSTASGQDALDKVKQLALAQRAVQQSLRYAGQNDLIFQGAGVSFEGRQENVKQLQKQQPLMLLPEPTNPHDPYAVAVMTLSGTQLGYVPKHSNQAFIHGAYPGKVLSAGQVHDPENGLGNWGFSCRTFPAAVPVMPMPLPTSYNSSQQAKRVEDMCTPGCPEHAAALQAAHGVCEVTALSGKQVGALEAVPMWVLDKHAHVARIKRFVSACQPVADAMRLFNLDPASERYQQAKLLLRAINNWEESDLAEFEAWAKDMQSQMDNENWKIEVP